MKRVGKFSEEVILEREERIVNECNNVKLKTMVEEEEEKIMDMKSECIALSKRATEVWVR